MHVVTRFCAPAIIFCCAAAATAPASAGRAASGLPRFAHWIDGTRPAEPTTQVQAIDPDTFVVRQSVKTNFEAPFLYLLFGRDRVLLLDTGAGGLTARPTIDRLIAKWRARHSGRALQLVVAHSHGHGDHRAGDTEFLERPATTVVGIAPEQVAAFFHIADWPRGIATFDLGGRRLTIIPTPGHEPAHIMVYDARTQLLLSGDMLYPGRLYVPRGQFDVFRESTLRLVAFARKHPIRALLGAHIEMTTIAGQDYAQRASTHPAEHSLPLPASAIDELQATLATEGEPPVILRRRDFILYPVPP